MVCNSISNLSGETLNPKMINQSDVTDMKTTMTKVIMDHTYISKKIISVQV